MDYVLRRCAELSKIYFGDIPQNDDESLEDFFFKYLTASRKGKISLLLLQKTCSKCEKNMVLEAWEKANISCM
jgi:hypothetical protein